MNECVERKVLFGAIPNTTSSPTDVDLSQTDMFGSSKLYIEDRNVDRSSSSGMLPACRVNSVQTQMNSIHNVKENKSVNGKHSKCLFTQKTLLHVTYCIDNSWHNCSRDTIQHSGEMRRPRVRVQYCWARMIYTSRESATFDLADL